MGDEKKDISQKNVEAIIKYLKGIIERDDNLREPLPSEYFLVNKFKVSRMTVRRALDQLKNQGFIISRKGSGYYKKDFQNFSQLYSIGSNSYHSYPNNEVDALRDNDEIFNQIINKLKINTYIESNDYYCYCKKYQDEHRNWKIYAYSFILKKRFKTINMDMIRQSLMSFICANEIDLFCQINTTEIALSNEMDRKNFNNQLFTPIIYGALVSKEDEYIEFFERHYEIEEYNPNWVKFY